MNDHRNSPVISAVVPCYEQSEELPLCLEALSSQVFDHPYEIILVDSASDPQVARIAREFPRVRLIRSARRLLCGSAKNLGAEHARAEYLAFTDSDCVPGNNWLNAAFQSLESSRRAVGGPVLDALPHNPIAVTDNLLQFTDVPPGRPAGNITHTPGCNFGIRLEVFEQAGGFLELESGEDVQLTNRINHLYPEGIHFNPDMRVAHTGRKTIAGLWNHQKHFGYWRGKLGLRITERQQHHGQRLVLIPLVIGKRMVYLFTRLGKWNKRLIARNILLLPLILVGLVSWSIGFRQGCIDFASNTEEFVYEE
jgi:glycosyltransferase involved in cell wall biosynthesis